MTKPPLNEENDANLAREISWLRDEKYHNEETADFFADCERLKSGEPLAYIIGYIPFLKSKIFLDSKPLIPRVETEFWVNQLIESYKDKSVPQNILDLCAGSGCICVALGRAFPLATITLVEIDKAHHQTITKNFVENGLDLDRHIICGGDLFSDLTPQKFSLIVSNPPYIDETLKRTAESVLKYEPTLALFAPAAGFSILCRIITEAPNWLVTGGELWLEHEPEHGPLIEEVAKKNFLMTVYKDQYSVLRFSKLVLQ